MGTKIAAFSPVTLVDAIVVYLSIGAPFGVLRSFSQGRERWLSVAIGSLTAVLLWPLCVTSRYISWSKVRSNLPADEPTDLLTLFEIGGHSNPEVARICYLRGRTRIAEHFHREGGDFPPIPDEEALTIETHQLVSLNTTL